MKYIFILNNHAGNRSAEKENEFLEQYKDKVEYALHLTIGKKKQLPLLKTIVKKIQKKKLALLLAVETELLTK